MVKTTFNQRRKTLRNNIRPLLTQIDTEQTAKGIQPKDHTEWLAQPLFQKRPEQLSVQDFIQLTLSLQEECGL